MKTGRLGARPLAWASNYPPSVRVKPGIKKNHKPRLWYFPSFSQSSYLIFCLIKPITEGNAVRKFWGHCLVVVFNIDQGGKRFHKLEARFTFGQPIFINILTIVGRITFLESLFHWCSISEQIFHGDMVELKNKGWFIQANFIQ